MKPATTLVTLTLALAAATPGLAAPQPDPASTTEPTAALGADAAAAPADTNPWRAELRAWAWLMGVEGDVGVRGRLADVSASFGDILDASDSLLAFSGRLEVGHDKFGAFIDGMYADVGAEDQSGPLGVTSIDVEFQQTILDFGVMYRIVDIEPEAAGPAANPRNLTVDLYAGGRYIGLDVEFDPDRITARQTDEDWIDPIVGAKAVFPFSEHWHGELNADIGGFGVSSDLTWSATAVVGYAFHMFGMPSTALLGYRIMGWDYSEGSGDNEFVWDLFQHGIILGLDIRW